MSRLMKILLTRSLSRRRSPGSGIFTHTGHKVPGLAVASDAAAGQSRPEFVPSAHHQRQSCPPRMSGYAESLLLRHSSKMIAG